ncbi:MAG: hypothetical protein EXR28_03930 [Betaproteobacteria bacterium]|nr:hypothetical protein [Betaproteobacteria bacterium]
MRTPQFDADALLPLFGRRQILTMEQMKLVLGTAVERTVLRKLQEFDYHSSYSHRGKFYTLDALAQFDEHGLWFCRGALFSRFGTLIDTAEQFVKRSDRGYLASELLGELQVPVKEPLLKLVSARRLERRRVAGQYVYCAAEGAKRTEQLHLRDSPQSAQTLPFLRDPLAQSSEETKAAIILFFSTLDERQRRIYAGLESLRLGHGGDTRIADLTGLDVHTIAKGRSELIERDVQQERIRRPGAGRPLLEKTPRKSSPRSKS